VSPFSIVGFTALALVAVGCVAIAVRTPGALRALLEWWVSCAFYVALLSLFAGWLVGSLESEYRAATLVSGSAIAILCVAFAMALVELARETKQVSASKRGSAP
jgi:ABC-type uncharacterized transport system permease subunit